MPNSTTKIAVSSRWDDRLAPISGQDHVTVSSRAKIEVATRHGTITVTTTPVPATRNRVRRLPLADAPGGEGPSDEGPSDGPPRRRQRTLHSFLVSSPASSTRSETMTERRVTRSYYVNESGEILSSAGSATSEAACRTSWTPGVLKCFFKYFRAFQVILRVFLGAFGV